MSLRFSEEGPAFPEQLVDSLLAGDVVFLCGAGISAPQLPNFPDLVELCFDRLHVDKSASEQASFDEKRYEEVLGSLRRRIVDPNEFTRTITDLLRPAPDKQPDYSHHRTILRLSRNLENRPIIVTTNFDTMLEQAWLAYESAEHVRALSLAGQDLPPPGSADFGGIIHLHGRIDDKDIGLPLTPLIITSADYGDAYMRSGWASRFLFDLCRCKTIVLIGYSAGDAPVRYFLNVLEADRERFCDLHRVYALTEVVEHGEADASWESVAVTPIPYDNGLRDHSALWEDLEKLAEVIERPRSTREAWARTILAKPFSETNSAELDRIAWLFNDRRDLWAVAIKIIEDAAWLDFFAGRKLWNEADAAWVVAKWMARHFESADQFKRAIGWRKKLDKHFASHLSYQLQIAKGLPEFWNRAWRLLSLSRPKHGSDWEEQAYAVQQALSGPVALSADLEKAVEFLTPVLELTPNNGNLYGDPPPDPPERLRDLTWPQLRLVDRAGARELLELLVEAQQPLAIMTIATGRLQAVIDLSIDIEDIRDDSDNSDISVPSVEPHPQNADRDGVALLIALLARLLPSAAEQDRVSTRGLVEVWRALPGRLGIRLWLHALRNSFLFTADDALAGLAGLSLNDFWSVRREVSLVLLERVKDANSGGVFRIEQRILNEGDDYYAQFSIEKGQADWRDHARDSAVWLRLKMIAAADKLSAAGVAELISIQKHRQYLDREVEDSDYFGSYSSSTGVQAVAGDAQPILAAQDTDRLRVAQEAITSPDIERQLGWSAYCQTDPRGAFDTLSKAPLDEVNAPLWYDLLESLAFPRPERDGTHHELVIKVFTVLERAGDHFIALIIRPLASLYFSAPRKTQPAIFAWWPRLFSTAVKHDTKPFEPDRPLRDDAFNSPGGRLTQAALFDTDELRKAGKPIVPELLAAIEVAAWAEGRQGVMARATLVENAGFFLAIEGLRATSLIDDALRSDSPESRALRSVLVIHGQLTAAATRTFSQHLIRGVTDFDGNEYEARAVAAKIIAPALAIVREHSEADRWGLTLDEIAWALRNGKPSLREGIADILGQWITQIEGGPEVAWRTAIGPLLNRIWPRERALHDRKLTRPFVGLAIKAGDAFPDALTWVLPYLDVIEGHYSPFEIQKSRIPEQFPRQTLTLLWKLFGIGCTGDLYGVSEILDRLIAACPPIEVDRRLQWLEQQVVRYE